MEEVKKLAESIKNIQSRKRVNYFWLKRQLKNKWQKYLSRNRSNLGIDKNKVRYDRNFRQWQLRWKKYERSTNPDFILNVDGMLVIVKVSSCWFDFIRGRCSYCLSGKNRIKYAEKVEDDRGKYKIVSCSGFDEVVSRGLRKATEDGKKLSRATHKRVKAVSVVYVYDWKVKRVRKPIWEERDIKKNN